MAQNTLTKGFILNGGKEKYKIVSVLGSGSFGITYHATVEIKHGNIPFICDVAIKEFYMPNICTRNVNGAVEVNVVQQNIYNNCKVDFKNEAESLRQLEVYEGIVKVNETFEANNTCYYVMEYLGESTLKDVIPNAGMCETNALEIFQKIVRSIAFLHKHRRLHLDLKPANIMFYNNAPYIIDFGASRLFNKNGDIVCHYMNETATLGYSSLELCKGIKTFSPSADIYSLGAILFFMLTGKDPVSADIINSNWIDGNLSAGISDKTHNVISRCLDQSPQARYQSAEDLLFTLNFESSVMGDDGATELIGSSDMKTWGESVKVILNKCSSVTKKAFRLSIVAVFLGLIIFALRHFVYNMKDDESKVAPIVDSEKKNGSNTTSVETTEVKDSKNVPPPNKNVSNIKGEGNQEMQNISNAQPIQKAESKKNDNSKELNLDWGTWTGLIKNGKPLGFGTLIVTRKKNINGIIAEKGDIIKECELNDVGGVYMGTLVHSDGTEEIILP